VQKNSKEKQKIFVGVSGGVDSSVVAYLLKKEGHDVHGVFIKTWSPEWLPCTWVAEKRDAMRVCAALDIPFHFLDAEQAYKDGVAEYMITEYRAGRTPNPDVLCNRVIKFGVLWEYAKTHGADSVATGHYAQTDGIHLMKGKDQSKDQSYFLWMLTKEELNHIVFPVGHLVKDQVRTIAQKAHLMTATKKDSQGICFLGDVDIREFLSHYIESKKGPVVDTDGKIIGEHDGVWFYTLGERHGFRITNTHTNTSPYYVVGKHIKNNELTVDTKPIATSLIHGEITVILRDVNWIEKIEYHKMYTAQIRYHGELIEVSIKNTTEVVLTYNGLIALGQSLVIYDGDTLVGGGIVDNLS
jgi:tRNA-specific 2-thiouridylase